MASQMEKLNKQQRRKRRRIAARMIFISVAVIAVFAIISSIFLTVSVISVVNPSAYGASEIMEVLQQYRNHALLTINKSDLSEELSVNFPYIKSAEVSVKLPDRLEIVIEAVKPVYSVEVSENEYLYLGEDLKVLEVASVGKTGTLKIKGMTVEDYEIGRVLDSEENIEASIILDLLTLLKDRGLYSRVTLLDLTKKYNIIFVLDNLIEVEMGNSEDFDKKIDMLLQILQRNPESRHASINVKNYQEGRYQVLD